VLSKTSIVQSHIVAEQQRLTGHKRKGSVESLPTTSALDLVVAGSPSAAGAAAAAAPSAPAADAAVDMVPTVQQIAALRRMCDNTQCSVTAAVSDTRSELGQLQGEVSMLRAQLDSIQHLLLRLVPDYDCAQAAITQPAKAVRVSCGY
jgi:hypothetical protein